MTDANTNTTYTMDDVREWKRGQDRVNEARELIRWVVSSIHGILDADAQNFESVSFDRDDFSGSFHWTKGEWTLNLYANGKHIATIWKNVFRVSKEVALLVESFLPTFLSVMGEIYPNVRSEIEFFRQTGLPMTKEESMFYHLYQLARKNERRSMQDERAIREAIRSELEEELAAKS